MKLKFDDINIDDPAIYKLISSGNTDLIFQLNSAIGKKYARLMKPKNIDEVAMLLALIRPNMLDVGMDKEFLAVRWGKKRPEYPDERIGRVLDSTYGCALYQEQIIELGKEVAGFSLAQADKLRYAVGKKLKDVMKEVRREFLVGALKNGYEFSAIKRIWNDYIKAAARYSFNKSHATGYAYISAATAWMNVYHPIEFICANLRHSNGDFDKIKMIVNVARANGIDVVPPSLTKAELDFAINGSNIMFGLSHIKGIGRSALRNVKKLKATTGISDFLYRTAINKEVDKTTVESLIFSGALDCIRGKVSRSRLYSIYLGLSKLTKKEAEGFKSRFDKNGRKILKTLYSLTEEPEKYVMKKRVPKLKEIFESIKVDVKDDPKEIIRKERDLLGLPLTACETDLYVDPNIDMCMKIRVISPDTRLRVCLVVDDIHEIVTKRGDNMAFISGYDSSYAVSVTVFSKEWDKIKDKFRLGDVVVIEGVKDSHSSDNLILNNLKKVEV